MRKLIEKQRILIILITALTTILLSVLAYGFQISKTGLKDFGHAVQKNLYNNAVENGGDTSVIFEKEDDMIINILFLGVDGFEKGIKENAEDTPVINSRSDSMIIATIDKRSRKIKLTSIMRDLWVPIYGCDDEYDNWYSKINASYALGGIEGALETVNKNFGLNINYYAVVNFAAFQELVDIIDGIEVEVKDYEIEEINKFINEVNGTNSQYLSNPGLQVLNGQQALSYSRIRKVGNNDFERTERQRRVISKIYEKMKKINIFKIPDIATSILANVHTNIPFPMVMDLGMTIYKFQNTNVESMRIPEDEYYYDDYEDGAAVLKADMKESSEILHRFIYEDIYEE